MKMKRLTKSLAVIGVAGLLATLSACSSSSIGPDGDGGDAIPPPTDAATDAVPAPGAENPGDLSAAADPNALPAPPADPNALPAPPADPNALPPPPGSDINNPILADASAPPQPSGADLSAGMPPMPAADPAAAPAPAPADPTAMAAPAPAPVDNTPPPAAAAPVASSGGGGSDSYTIQQGDTLMKIAFETYGDLYAWKKVYENNKSKISDPNNLSAGVTLNLDKPADNVTIERNGEKYLIKKGDTLGTIATDLYGTKAKWKKIWKNNKQLIKNPNKIFAGFFLYYTMSPEERDEADKLRHETAPAPVAAADPAPAAPAVDPSRTTASVDPVAPPPMPAMPSSAGVMPAAPVPPAPQPPAAGMPH